MAGDVRFDRAKEELENIRKERRKVSMCELLDTIENIGIAKGLAQGLEQGLE